MTNATPVRPRPPLTDDRQAPARAFTRDASLGSLFAEVARAHPHVEALAWEGGRLSYAELDARANRLARHLQGVGVRAGDRVGISLARWPDLGVVILAAVKAGASYVPLDAAYPAERLAFMRRDAGIAALVVAAAADARLEPGEEVRVVALDEARAAVATLPAEAPDAFACGESEAYVVYTSGSTGTPKGSAITHRGIARLVRGADYLRLGPGHRFAQLSNTSFDAATYEIWGALLSGATLVALDRDALLDPAALAAAVREWRLTTLFLTTAVFNAAAAALPGAFAPLEHLLFGGEAADAGAVRRVLAAGAPRPLLHMYGPSESATFATWHPVTKVDEDASTVPIGRPVAHTTAHLLDGEMRPVADGEPGELYLGGEGLAHGYIGRPALTADRFVPDPFSARGGDRLYRTGDLARRSARGELEFLGRADGQVKLRGLRVELGEIEAALLRHPSVAQAVVLLREDAPGDRRLAAYAVPRAGEAVDAAQVRDWLKERLPGFMVPAAVVPLDAFPLTPNGKVDRRALPAPSADDRAEGTPPATETERRLAAAWAEVLRVERVYREDDFFDLGGQSLLASQVTARIRQALGVELSLRRVFAAPTLAAMAAAVDEARGAGRLSAADTLFRRDAGDGCAPLSHAQRQLWVIERMNPGGAAYVIAHPLRISGALDVAALERALDALRARHAPLRTTFAERDGTPVQVVHPPVSIPLPVDDLSPLSPAAREHEARARMDADAGTGFDLEAGPVFRARLLRLAGDEHLLLLAMHHVASDGWSMGVLQRDLGALYAAFAAGRPDPLPPLPVEYADYAAWQEERLEGEALEHDLAFWRLALDDAPPALELPTDRPRPAVESYRGATMTVAVSAAVAERLREVARAEGGTLFHALLAALRVVLSRHAGQDEVVIGTPVANRPRTELEGLVGFFVNMLALRTPVEGDPSFRALVAAERESALAAFEHQSLPFDRLVEELRLARDPGRNPVFQAVMTLQNARMETLELAGCRVEAPRPASDTARFDLTFDTYEEGDGSLRLEVNWATDLFDAPSVRRLAGHYLRLLETASAAPEAARSALEMDDAAERAFVIEACNRTGAEYERDTPVHRLFEARAAETPDAVAVDAGEILLTYAELNARANRLARRLAAAGAGAEDRVGVAMERSADLVVALLAVLKAGAAYVPLDAQYPAERLAYMVADAGVSVLVVADEVPSTLAGFGGAVVRTAEDGEGDGGNLTVETSPDGLAYAVYTSGSTGKPKGVAVPHRGVVRLVRGADYAPFARDDVFLLLAPVAFDASTFEIWGPLLNGGRLAVAPPHQLSLRDIGRTIEEKKVNTLWLTAGLLPGMVDEEVEALGRLRHLVAGGDVISAPHVARVVAAHPRLRVTNGYGPTENTTFTTCHDVRPEDVRGASIPQGRPLPESHAAIPIGRPIANTTVYVLDSHGRPCAIGVPGELCTGGDGVARGYLGRAGLTADRFVPDPFSSTPGTRLYRTGDRVRRREDGTLEFLGRMDQQVKVRGFRIEPEEVETALKAHPTVGDAIVIARAYGAGEKRLIGYVVARNCVAPDPVALRAGLAEHLPEHMVPVAVVVLSALPLTPNGKVDRRALPAPEGLAEAFEAARTPAEELLAEIFGGLLGGARVGAEDDFFRLGGHSLLATQLASRLRRAFGVEVPLRAIFEAPTVRRLAAWVEAARGETPEERAPMAALSREGALPLSFAQERLWFLERLYPGRGLYNMPVRHRVDGAVDAEALRGALEAVVARHEALRARYREVDGAPVQEIAAPGRVELPVVDVADEAEAEAWLAAEAWRPFDLERGPLLRAALVRWPNDAHVLALNVHHSAGDGWSWGLLFRDLSAAYAAALGGADVHLPPLPLQYADFAAWQRDWLAGDRLEAQLAYWRGALEGAPALLELPTDRPRPALPANRGALLSFALSPELTRRVHALAAKEGATLFMTLLAAFQALLARWSGQRDIVVGSPIAGRHHGEAEEIAGFFVNTLPLRARLEDDPSFRALLAQVRRATLDAYAHQDLPFERMVEELRVERTLSHGPVFQVLFGLQNMPPYELRLEGAEAREIDVNPRAAKFDLSVELREADGRIGGGIEYDADLFDAATVERLAGHFRLLLEAVCADAEAHPLRAGLLTAGDHELLAGWSEGEPLDAARLPALPDAFAARAAERPEAPAIRFRGETITYGELDARANRIARRLLALGAGREARVGVCLPRTPDSVAALLGVMKAGAAYVPLDPSYPPARLATVLADAGAVAAVSTTAFADRLPSDLPALLLDRDAAAIAGETGDGLEMAIDPTSLAYVLYTSGSTGTPKGVMIEHGSVAGLLEWIGELVPAEERAVVLASTSFSFDVSVAEVFGTLCRGGSLVLVENAIELAEVAPEEGVRSAFMVPTAAAELLRLRALPASLRTLNLAGEALPGALVDQLLATGTVRLLRNIYGPTEATVYATWADAREGDPRPPIGRPVGGGRAYVLDAWLRPVPPGLPGELYLSGSGVARGYAGRPALTAEKFVPDPFSPTPGARMYRTGDRARWLPTGEVEYLGRLDTQVKLRGFRIELGEVESALLRHPAVSEAVAIVRDDTGDARLVAYVVPAAGAAVPDTVALRTHLRERLPDYMVPGAYVPLDALPLTPSGKVDRRALPAPALAGSHRARTATEAVLAELWGELLEAPRVGPDDSFFALGGHSLLAMRLVAAVHARLGVAVPLREVFDFPRLADLAARVDRIRGRSLEGLLAELGVSEDEAEMLVSSTETESPES